MLIATTSRDAAPQDRFESCLLLNVACRNNSTTMEIHMLPTPTATCTCIGPLHSYLPPAWPVSISINTGTYSTTSLSTDYSLQTRKAKNTTLTYRAYVGVVLTNLRRHTRLEWGRIHSNRNRYWPVYGGMMWCSATNIVFFSYVYRWNGVPSL